MKSSLFYSTTGFLLIFLFFNGFGLFGSGATASPKESKEDSLMCLQQLSVASLALEKEMYKHAIGPWRLLFNTCPDLSVRIYSDGIKLFEHFVETSKDDATRSAYLDTLKLVYDKRIEYFGDHEKYPEGWILGRKGVSIVKYDRGNTNSLKEAYDCFQKSYSQMGDRTEPAVMIAWIQTSRVLVQKGELPEEDFLKNYFTVYRHISADNFKKQYNERVYKKIFSAVENIFHPESFNCQTFSNILTDAWGANDLELSDLNVFLDLMDMADCSNSELYFTLVERKYEISPSGEGAVDLARMFIKQGGYNRAVNYYEEAIEKTSNDSLKALYYFELAVLKDGHFNESIEARQFAKRASALLPTWGKPHLLLGSIYARASAALKGDELEKSAVYWAAVDQFMLAMRKDPDCSKEARDQIDVYSKYFPDKQTCFFHGLDEGQDFVVGDWINEPTTVRFR